MEDTTKKTKNKIPISVDYCKILKKYDSKRIINKIVHKIKLLLQENNRENIITIKIETSEKMLPIADVIKILDSTGKIIKNICIALGYNENDIEVNLSNAKSGCFLLEILFTISKSAIAKYSTGFIEGLLEKDLEKESRRQAKMVKEIFQKLIMSPEIKNAATPEAKNIKEAKKIMYMTFNNNKKIKSVNFTENPNNKIERGKFLDYTI